MSPSEVLNRKPLIDSVPGTECSVCRGTIWTVVGAGQDFEYETCSNEWSYRSCNECGHVQIDPIPALNTLATIYPPSYYSYVMNDSVHPIARWAKNLLDRRKFRGITSIVPTAASYLDVGCGDGRYLELMIDKGVDRTKAYGVELDAQAVAVAAGRGLQVNQCRIEDATHLSSDQFDLITMFHVIEHVAHPDEVVRRLHEVLSPRGVLAIETPNFDSLDARISRRRFWGGYHIPRHWHIFTPESLQRLLINAGFSVVAVKYQTGHAFWLWTLHHWLKYRKGWTRAAKFCHPLRNVPLLAVATAFDLVRAGFGQRTSAMLVLARKQ